MLSVKPSTEILPEPSKNTKNNENIDRDTVIVPESPVPEKLTATQENNLVKQIEGTKIDEDKNDTKEQEQEKEEENFLDVTCESDPDLMVDEDGEQMYLVEEILEHKPKTASNHSKAKKYKILWEGYNDPSEHTWEPANSIFETAEPVVTEYWDKVEKQKEITKANLKKKKEVMKTMKITGAQKRRRFPDEIPEESIEQLNDSLDKYQKVTELNEKLAKEDNENSKKLIEFLEESKRNTKPHLQMGLMTAVYKVLKENKSKLPLKALREELKDYLHKLSVEVADDSTEGEQQNDG